jgi:hypothetical protein
LRIQRGRNDVSDAGLYGRQCASECRGWRRLVAYAPRLAALLAYWGWRWFRRRSHCLRRSLSNQKPVYSAETYQAGEQRTLLGVFAAGAVRAVSCRARIFCQRRCFCLACASEAVRPERNAAGGGVRGSERKPAPRGGRKREGVLPQVSPAPLASQRELSLRIGAPDT